MFSRVRRQVLRFCPQLMDYSFRIGAHEKSPVVNDYGSSSRG